MKSDGPGEMHSVSEMEEEMLELHRATVLATVGHSIDHLQAQLSGEVGQRVEFVIWIHEAIKALERASGKFPLGRLLLEAAILTTCSTSAG